MNGKNREKLERLLTPGEAPEPPAQLLDKIKSEIPAELPKAEPPVAAGAPRWWGWRMAASLFVLVGFGYVAFRVGQTYQFSPDATVPSVAASPAEVRSEERGARERESERARERESERAREREGERARSEGARVDSIEKDDASRPAPAAKPAGAVARQMVASEGPADHALEPPAQMRDQMREKSADAKARPASGVVGGVLGGVIGGVVGGVEGVRESITVASPAPAPPPSTGGTAEPNAQPYGDVFFKHYGVNPFIDTEDDPLSTFGLDVDTASYSVARRYLLEGHLPPAAAIRPEEFLNSFDYGDAPPSRGDFAIYVEGAESPFPRGPRYAMLRFGIRAREIPRAARAPAVLTFVVDISGPMARQNRIELVKEALLMLLDQLREDDDVGLVVFSDDAEVLLEPTGDHEAIRQAIVRLRPRGSTNAGAGLRLGYEVAAGAFRRGANNRVVFLSDGVANVGTTRAEDILRQVERFKERGILLNSVGVGMGNFNDVLLEQIADKGNGTYAYIDDLEEAHRLFVENLTGTLQTVAVEARVQVQFNPRTVQSYRLIGYENRDIADERFRDDTIDAGEIGAGHGVTALYELKMRERIRAGDHLGTLTLRYRPSDRGRFHEVERRVPVSTVARSWESSPRSFQLATLVATFAEMLRESHWARHVPSDELEARLEALAGRLGADQRVRELREMVRRAAELRPPVVEE